MIKKRHFLKVKNYILAGLCAGILITCSRTENFDDTTNKNNILHKEESAKNTQSSFAALLNADPSNRCSGSYTPISIDPSHPYYDNYNVYYFDGYTDVGGNCATIGNHKPCISLSRFLSSHGAHSHNSLGNEMRQIAFFYGENAEMDFIEYRQSGYTGYYETASFTIGAESNSYFFTGGVGNTMPNDAVNTVLHYFKNQVATLPVSYSGIRPKIAAVHYSVKAYLCIPPLREVKMSVKYRY